MRNNRDLIRLKSIIAMVSKAGRGNRSSLFNYFNTRALRRGYHSKHAGAVRSNWLSRAADQYGGRIVLIVLGLFHRHPRDQTELRKIGLCALGAIGDAIISSAIVFDLKRHFPHLHVTMIVSSTNKGVVPLLNQIDDLIILSLFRPISTVRTLRKERFDLLIDANQWLRISAVYCALAGAVRTIGFRTPSQHRHYAYSDIVNHSPTCHELENFRALLGPLKIPGVALPRILIDKSAREGILAELPARRFIVFHAWAGGSNAELKQWPNEKWVELADLLSQKGFLILATGGQADTPRTQSIVDAGRECGIDIISVAGRFNLTQTAALLAEADFVVSVNTGIMHLAAAVGTPVIGLHGPTNPRRWGPLGPNSVSIVPDAPAGLPVGYLNLGFEFPPNVSACMQFLSVQRVMEAIEMQGF